ncbi:thermonuclease family protein [uncultured Roseovarius sp.]|uniref:thermonuclease family protein n=1 Tax=Roseovarius sp. TaxID=1486281 RepID=UPI0025CD0C29|nr:thermonuclease family protein [uncultured Roseovarius sp.]
MLRICTLFVLAMACPGQPAGAQTFSGRVVVIDGDTLDVGQTRVRLHGIDAPELGQTCTNRNGVSWDCGTWVADQVRRRFEGHRARCQAVEKDKYGRTVARCEVADQDIGRALVRDGLALAYRQYSMAYDLDEKGAAVSARGLHGHVMARPAEYRRNLRDKRAGQNPAPDPTCVIKGNINGKGRRIYHMPGQQHYERTTIRTARAERWFCSEAEARAAGWRRAKR